MIDPVTESLPSSLFDLVERSPKPVLVDFYAHWCGPCRMMEPVVQQLAKRFRDRLLLVKVDVDRKQRLAAFYGVVAIPTFILFHRGQVVWRQEGALSLPSFEEELEKVLGSLNSSAP